MDLWHTCAILRRIQSQSLPQRVSIRNLSCGFNATNLDTKSNKWDTICTSSILLNHDNTEQREPPRWFVVGKITKTGAFLPRPSSLSPLALARVSFSLGHFLRQNVIIRFSWLHVLIFVMYLRDVVMTVLGADVIYTWQTSQVIGQVQVLFSGAAEEPTRCLPVLEEFQWQIHTLFEVGVEYISGRGDVCVPGDTGRGAVTK